jgi:hypothetical protein
MTFELSDEDLTFIYKMFDIYESHKKRTIKMIMSNSTGKVTADLAIEKHQEELEETRSVINKFLEQY